jgi:hypothetical protein
MAGFLTLYLSPSVSGHRSTNRGSLKNSPKGGGDPTEAGSSPDYCVGHPARRVLEPGVPAPPNFASGFPFWANSGSRGGAPPRPLPPEFQLGGACARPKARARPPVPPPVPHKVGKAWVVPRSRARAPRARGSPPRRPRGGPPRGPPAVLKIYPIRFRPYFGAWGACACMARPQNLVPVGLATFENGGVGCAGAGCWTRHTFPRLFPVSGRKLFPPQHGWAPRNPRGRAVARTVRAPARGVSALPHHMF